MEALIGNGVAVPVSSVLMPAVPDVRPPSVSTTGFADGLGRRSIRFDRESGTTLECLHLRPELAAFEPALRRQAKLIEELGHERIVRVQSFESFASRVTVVSELLAGDRLSDVIEARACGESAVSGIDTAFGFLLQILPTLSAMHAANLIHGAIAPHRIVLTTNSQVVLADAIYGVALPRLNLSQRRAWNEFAIASPSAFAPARVDAASDVSQAALSALMLALGRPLTAVDPATSLHELVREAVEIAQIRGGDSLSENVRTFFSSALGIPAREHRVSAERAIADVRAIARTQLGEDTCLAALAEFARYDPPPPTIIPVRPVPVSVTIARPQAADAGAFDFWTTAPDEPSSESSETHDPGEAAALAKMFEPEPEAPPAPAPVSKTEIPDALRDAFVTPPLPEAPPVAPTVAPEVEFVPKPITVIALDKQPEPESQPQPASQPEPERQPELEREPEPERVPVPVAPVAVFRPIPPVLPPPIPVLAPVAIPAPLQNAPSPALRIKEEAPSGYAPPRIGRTFDAEAEEAPARRLPWKIVAAAVVVLTVGALVVRASWRPEPSPPPDALTELSPSAAAADAASMKAAPGMGTLTITSTPVGARVLLDGADSGSTPLRLESVAAGRHTITLVTETTTVKRAVRVTAGQTTTLDVPVFSGWVAVFAPIVLEVAEGSRSLGTTEQSRIMLSPGRHTLTLSHPEYGYSTVETVEIVGGEEKTLNITPMGTVNLNAQPWAEVWVDGAKAGETPLANLPVALGTRVFLFKHPQFGERRITETITSKPAALSVDLTKPPSRP